MRVCAELAHMTVSIFTVTFIGGVYAVQPSQHTHYCNKLGVYRLLLLSHTGETYYSLHPHSFGV